MALAVIAGKSPRVSPRFDVVMFYHTGRGGGGGTIITIVKIKPKRREDRIRAD